MAVKNHDVGVPFRSLRRKPEGSILIRWGSDRFTAEVMHNATRRFELETALLQTLGYLMYSYG